MKKYAEISKKYRKRPESKRKVRKSMQKSANVCKYVKTI